MKALSIKQPWASLIIEGIKDIENRTWKTSFRGTILVHSSAKLASKYDEQLLSFVQLMAINDHPNGYLGKFKRPISAILGTVDIVDCVINHPSIWAEKTDLNWSNQVIYNWVIKNPVKFENPILNVKGKLSFWDYPL